MQLWSDYEGKTVAGAYPLEALIRPEGRSAFFRTFNGTGNEAVIRLTESLNDEESEQQMLNRWRRVAALKQEHLVTIRRFGHTRVDSTQLTFALMEPADGNLGDLLKERPLSAAETREVAVSVLDALTALHANGLVHGQVAAANVVAVGDVVKLRSDCVRECKSDSDWVRPGECEAMRRRDVQDAARLLLESLTLERRLAPLMRLPAPFDRMVAHGLDGSWGLREMQSALRAPVFEMKPSESPGRVVMSESVLSVMPDRIRGGGPRLVRMPPKKQTHTPRLVGAREAEVEGLSASFWLGCIALLLLVMVLAMRLAEKPSEALRPTGVAVLQPVSSLTPLARVRSASPLV